jgi:hypothetical protein
MKNVNAVIDLQCWYSFDSFWLVCGNAHDLVGCQVVVQEVFCIG